MIDDANALSGRTTATDRRPGPSRRTAPARPPLAQRAHDLIGLVKALGDDPSPHDVHQLRTTIRRVETLVGDDGLASGRGRKLQKQLDRIRKRAGKVRDADVHVKAIRTLRRALDASARDDLRKALERSRDKRAKRLLRALGDERDRGIVKRLKHVVDEAGAAMELRATDPSTALARVLDDFAQAYESCAPLGTQNLHTFRIATKKLRYRAEVLASGAEAGVAVTELKRAQDAIGDWHDWLTLVEVAEEAIDAPASPLLTAVRERAETQLHKAVAALPRIARRLQALRSRLAGPSGQRKGVRPVTAPLPVPTRSAGATA
jgi:CHAD domain-containing protein